MLKSKHMPSLRSAASSVYLFVAWPKKRETEGNFSRRNDDNNDNSAQQSKGNCSLINDEGYSCWRCISETASVRIHLDTGSQRTYITNRWKSKLNLSPVKSETLHLNTFGYERYTKQQCDVVNLHLQGSLGEIEISALCFPKICLAVSVKVNVHIYTHLQGLELADASIVEGGGGDWAWLRGSKTYRSALCSKSI